MAFRFLAQKLVAGLYEPEGVYLAAPVDAPMNIGQGWGANPEYYTTFLYNQTPLKGHNGIDLIVNSRTRLLAVDHGRVSTVGYERHGYERYLKIEHRWGESFYAYVDAIEVDAGQMLMRGEPIARATQTNKKAPLFFHFGIRMSAFNRFDGWGGFCDPTPFLNPDDFLNQETVDSPMETLFAEPTFVMHPMLHETTRIRRP
jgi:murein DD-endopeptidase MepM/ murein hydrolase activator NlpD